MATYLLEKSRLCYRLDAGESSFHMFYYVLAGVNHQKLQGADDFALKGKTFNDFNYSRSGMASDDLTLKEHAGECEQILAHMQVAGATAAESTTAAGCSRRCSILATSSSRRARRMRRRQRTRRSL